MQAGRLRHRLLFQSPVPDARDTTGDDLGTYENRFTVWGAIEPLRGQAFFAAQQVNPEISGQARVRYSEDTALIEASWRIVHAGKTYAITAPPLNPDVRNRELTMLIQEMPVNATTRN